MEKIRCKRCNRILKSKKSIELGFGATCYRIHKLQEANKPENTIDLEHELIVLKEQINMMGKYIKIQELQNNEIVDLEELLNRVKKLELDNNFMKCQLKHKSFVIKSKDSNLDWDIPKEVSELIDVYEIKFNDIVKELKGIFKVDNFDYHDVLNPVDPIEEIVIPPVILA